jgi:hypothetical protein
MEQSETNNINRAFNDKLNKSKDNESKATLIASKEKQSKSNVKKPRLTDDIYSIEKLLYNLFQKP